VTARCATCQAVIDAQRAAGRIYTARQQDNDPWTVAFLGERTRRATGVTLHEAIKAAKDE
jgi:hypothetical protein